jgi:hypothetical protein
MALQKPPPAQPQKKSGLGCFGCGCLIVVVILLLLGGLVGGMAYFVSHQVYLYTSVAPMDIPAYSGSDDVYNGALKKIDALNQAVGTGNTGSLTLSSDEVNGLISHDPAMAQLQTRAVVTMNGEEARLEGTVPTNNVPLIQLMAKDRYINVDATFALHFNSDTKMIEIDLHKATLGDKSVPADELPSMQAWLNQMLTQQLKKNIRVSNLFQAAKMITVRDGQFVIETK